LGAVSSSEFWNREKFEVLLGLRQKVLDAGKGDIASKGEEYGEGAISKACERTALHLISGGSFRSKKKEKKKKNSTFKRKP